MSNLEYLKLGHEVKDAVDIAHINNYMNALTQLANQGQWYDVNRLICEISEKYKQEAKSYNEGRQPARTPQEAASACYQFLKELRDGKVVKKAEGKAVEEALKHLGGN